jgi:isopenicillin N synthase-like dioxygenase
MSIEALPVIDISNFLKSPESAQEECKKIVQCLHETSCLIIKDPRVTFQDNEVFLNTMEKYYDQPFETKKKDARPEWSYQVGSTPEFTEVPRNHEQVIDGMNMKEKPHKPNGPDPKWRFFWRCGEMPPKTDFPSLNMPQVIPEGFPEWEQVMNRWASLMLGACTTVAEMIAVGMEMPQNTFSKMMKYGPHLLAPTGSDLNKYNKLETVFAGFHYDLNFLTIHGKSRYPGLYIWLRNGTKIPVRVPDGCLLLQAGKQIEWLTGGYITAGFHEVVVNEDTLKAVEKAKAEGRPLWRVSSTLFSHIASDETLYPVKKEWQNDEKYPAIKTGNQVNQELQSINLQKTGANNVM